MRGITSSGIPRSNMSMGEQFCVDSAIHKVILYELIYPVCYTAKENMMDTGDRAPEPITENTCHTKFCVAVYSRKARKLGLDLL